MGTVSEQIDNLRRTLILESAHKYFDTLGYEKTSIDKIAKDLSIGVGTIYQYYGSKQGLFYAWLDDIIENAYKELQRKKISDPLKKLYWYVEYKLNYYEKNIDKMGFYVKNPPYRHDPKRKLYDYIAQSLEELVPGKDTLLLARILDSITNCYIAHTGVNLMSRRDEIVETFLKILKDD